MTEMVGVWGAGSIFLLAGAGWRAGGGLGWKTWGTGWAGRNKGLANCSSELER